MEKGQSEKLGGEIEGVQTRQIGELPLVYPLLQALGVRELTNALVPSQAAIDLGGVVEVLTLNRLLSPRPLYQVGEWLAGTVLPEVVGLKAEQLYDNRIGRALDRLYPHLGELWAKVVSRAVEVYDLDLRTLHWDLTSLYLEGDYSESDLAAYGYSRDGRSDTKQVNLQVDTTHQGHIPILYQVLTGNTADITRPLPHLKQLLAFVGRPELQARHVRPLLVSDCKMVTPEAVLACHANNLYYLGPVADTLATRAVLRCVSEAALAQHPLAYRPQRVRPDDVTFVPYAGVWRTIPFEHGGRQVTDRALVVWSWGKAHLDQHKRRTYLKRLLNGLEGILKRLNTRRYKRRHYVEERIHKLSQGNPAKGLVDIDLTGDDGALSLCFRLNSDRLQAAQALDGRYLLATNAHHLDANQALTLFKGQDGVEKRIRAIKGPLRVRPLFVRSDQRIEGLIFISLLALLLRALLEQHARQCGLAATANRLLRPFAQLQAVDLYWRDGSQQRQAVTPTPDQSRILATLGWPPPVAYARLSSC